MRIAVEGSRDAARRAGTTAEASPTTVASKVALRKRLGSSVIRNLGAPLGSSNNRSKKAEKPAPMAEPTNEPARPKRPPWIKKMRRMRERGGPTARRMPISRDYWTTETMSTLAIPSATATTTKN